MGITVTEATAHCSSCGNATSTHTRVCSNCGHCADNYCCNCMYFSNSKETCTYGVNVYSNKPACPGFKYNSYLK